MLWPVLAVTIIITRNIPGELRATSRAWLVAGLALPARAVAEVIDAAVFIVAQKVPLVLGLVPPAPHARLQHLVLILRSPLNSPAEDPAQEPGRHAGVRAGWGQAQDCD